jgi:hypothetical protein
VTAKIDLAIKHGVYFGIVVDAVFNFAICIVVIIVYDRSDDIVL